MNKDSVHIADIVDMNDPHAVMEETRCILGRLFPSFDFSNLDRAFEDTLLLFSGKMPGYRACNTRYHDLKHTTDALLAMARLIDGAVLSGIKISASTANVGLIATLFHDAGYIQEVSDISGTGAKYTRIHEERSAEFLRRYFTERGYSNTQTSDGASIIKCTGLSSKFQKVSFSSAQSKLAGKMLGTADLLGQMADRTYLEKLHFLYHEFVEGHVGDYSDELDLLKKTVDFYQKIRIRLDEELGGVCKFARIHFRDRLQIDRDLYREAVETNIKYIRLIVAAGPESYRGYLKRRSGLSSPQELPSGILSHLAPGC
jgi:hypothetical protein